MVAFDGSINITWEHPMKKGMINFGLNAWNNLRMKFDGDKISALLNGKKLYEISDTTYSGGMTGFGCGWHCAIFDNLEISPIY
jgi:hypothetical protein